MAEIVNLRRRRKQAVRTAEARRAEANRALHGTPVSRREADAEERRRAEREHAGKRLEAPPED